MARKGPILAGALLALMAVLAGGAAWRESVTVDEVTHIGAGVSYLQRFDLRLNPEHPPLAKVVAAAPLVLRGTRADYSSISWTIARDFLPAFLGQWPFGEWLLARWNNPVSTLAWARTPMLLLALILGWILYVYARRLGGDWGGLLCLSVYAGTPVFLAVGPLVHTDVAVTLFSLLTLWTFAELWKDPSRHNTLMFALCLAGALLSKYTAGILFFAFAAVALSTRWRPQVGQASACQRRLRWRAMLKGICWATLAVYAFYFVFSWNQSSDALDRLGQSPLVMPLRRLLMPPWLYLRGLLMVAVTSSRPTFILGHAYPHGIWFYFPVLLVLKSPLGFLGLLVLAGLLALRRKARALAKPPAVPAELAVHWRVLWVSLVVYAGACLLSRLNIGFRHFSVPLVLLILLLAPLPKLLDGLSEARLMKALTAVLAGSCLFTALRAYPYYFPYVNALSLGNPVYALANDSNVDWGQALPEVRRFAERHGLDRINLDDSGLTDPTVRVPQSQLWDCQRPAAADAGRWAVVSANMILDAHNCRWLIEYPHQALAGGSMYAVLLPNDIPAAGRPGGPPLPSDYRELFGAPSGTDMRGMYRNLVRNPEKLPQAVAEMQAQISGSDKSQKR